MLLFFSFVGGLSILTAQKPAIEWAEIPAGEFKMGSPGNEIGRETNESIHNLKMGAFKMSKYEITVGQFKSFVDATGFKTDADKNSGGVKGGAKINEDNFVYTEGVNWKCDINGNIRPESEYNYPVVNVSWNDAKAFADWMGASLPTEAQWEYACRAGTTTGFYTGECITSDQANFNGTQPSKGCDKSNYKNNITPVGSYPANAWGLYDMHGNVWEWCSDWYAIYDQRPQNDPKGPLNGTKKAGRGGSWYSNARDCRSANRNGRIPEYRNFMLGFRIVMN